MNKKVTEINDISKKIKNTKDDSKEIEYFKKLYDLATSLLSSVRIERAKHLKRIEKLKEFGFWCLYKHFIGAMMQFGEVGAKDAYMGELENTKKDFETSSFCHDAIVLMNHFANIYKKDLSKKKQK